MTIKSFTALCAGTIIALVLAGVAILGQPRFETSDPEKTPVFPNLVTDVERLKTVVIRHAGETHSFDWDGKTWTARDQFNYLASREKLTGLIVFLARMTKIEGKTKVPARYARLEVEDPTAKAGRGRQVTLIDSAGKEIANVIVGKRHYNMGSQSSNSYIRLPGDPQVWLASGEMTPDMALMDWLERGLTDMNPAMVRRVTVTHPNGEKIVVGRESPESPTLVVENLPKAQQEATATVAEEYARILTAMSLEDVAPSADKPFPKDKTITAVIEGLTGATFTVELAEIDGQEWIKLKAALPPGGGSKAGDSGMIDLSTDWGKIVADVNARAEGWVFRVPEFQTAPLKYRLADLAKRT